MPKNSVRTRSLLSHRGPHTRRGAMLVLLAAALPVLLIMAAFAVNVAYMELVRTELRSSTDFSARAGARTLSMTGDQTSALAALRDTASRNVVDGSPLVVASSDVEFGRADRATDGSFLFLSTTVNPNAVRINGNRLGPGNSVKLFFGNVLGTSTFETTMSAAAAQIDRDIAVVLDRSGSMARKTADGSDTEWESLDPAPDDSRWIKAVEGIVAFLQALNGTPMDEQVALVTYNENGVLDHALTLSYTPIPLTLDVYTQSYADGWTNIAAGIEQGRQSLLDGGSGRPWAAKTIVVITDGIHNSGELTPIQAATTAAAQGVVVHTITFGSDADTTQMQAVAEAGKGQHWHAPSQIQLFQAFDAIADNSPTMLIE